ncbi:MAG: hypothetical protein AB8B87_09095 [Granulosicoccus sp.]
MANNWQATEKTSFESALNRIRDRNVSKDAAADTVKNDDQYIDELTVEDADEQSEVNSSGLDAGTVADSQSGLSQSTHTAFSDVSDSFFLDMASQGSELSAGATLEGIPMEIQGASSGAASRASTGSVMTVETVAQMMSRLERSPGTHNGQWRFGVLNEQAGVTALQLQRSLNGGWRVNVSFNENSLIDEHRHAEELKAALVKEGHDIDSVVVSKLASHIAPTDD